MKKEHKYAHFGFIALTALGSIGIEKPDEQSVQSAVVSQEKHELVLDKIPEVFPESKILPNPVPETSFPVFLPLPPKTVTNPQSEVVIFESQKYINEHKDQKVNETKGDLTIVGDEDEYGVHWENFDFGHNLETVRSHNDLIVKYSKKNQLPPDVIAGIIFVESNGFDNGNEKTGVGKMGVMPKGPLLPRRPEAKELLDDEENISWGTSILEIILHNSDPETGGQEDMFRSVALYNAGHVDLLLLQPHGWYYVKKVFYSIGMKDEFNAYIGRNKIQLED